MNVRELIEKLSAIEEQDVPVVMILDQFGAEVELTMNVYGVLSDITMREETADCPLPPGDHKVLILTTKPQHDEMSGDVDVPS